MIALPIIPKKQGFDDVVQKNKAMCKQQLGPFQQLGTGGLALLGPSLAFWEHILITGYG
jgi:hypothetical protein